MRRYAGTCAVLAVIVVGAATGGCGSLPSLTTGSLFGSSDAKKAAEAAGPPKPVAPPDTPANRGFQVGMVSARAIKCGFVFDPGRLKGNWLASEAQSGTAVEDIGKAEKSYNAGFNGVARAVAKNEKYCSEKKSREIKADLALLLAGNFTPQPFHAKEEDDDGILTVGGTKFTFE